MDSRFSQTNTGHMEVETNVNLTLTHSNPSEDQFQIKRDLEEGRVFLTWEDLHVAVPNRCAGGTKFILHGLTGCAWPGQLLAIMGPSGCGKSTLLDVLAGRLSSTAMQSGEVLINGRKQALSYGASAYVTQEDTLIATLTVREALYYSAQLQLPADMSKSDKAAIADATIKEMGLQDAADTRIGGAWGARGLSGGQRRRVSICTEILTGPRLLFLDEPTSGLDSAASFYVMNRISEHCQRDRTTVVASIHQPSSEVFQLFDNLCLLSSGRTVYFGPPRESMEFFTINGFPCPALQNPSDHFLRTINKDFDEDVEGGMSGERPTEEAIGVLVNSYKSSDKCKQVRAQVSNVCKLEYCEALMEEKRTHASFGTQCLVLTKRSALNMHRDLGYYWLRLAIYIVIALGLGTVFYNVGFSYASIQARGSMIMFVASFLTFMAIGGFPSFVEDMKVFRRERLNGNYGSTAFVIGNTVSSIPYLALISLIPGALAYCLAGLHEGSAHFTYFGLVLFTCMMLVESLMMIVASVVPNYLMGIITGAGIQGVMILCGGFFRLPHDIPSPVWKYPLYYISFHGHAYQGLFKNEFEGLTFPSNNPGGLPLKGKDILRVTWQINLGYSKWVNLGILLGMVVGYRVLFLVIVKSGERVGPLVRAFQKKTIKQATQVVENPTATPGSR